MADRAKTRAQSAGVREANEKRTPTRRVVLERVRVIPLSDGDLPPLGAMQDAEQAEAWIERAVVVGDRQQDAIRAYVKPGTPEQRTGTFRAVAESAWRGGRSYRQPELVPVKEEALDEPAPG